jgi:hypothetical protein
MRPYHNHICPTNQTCSWLHDFLISTPPPIRTLQAGTSHNADLCFRRKYFSSLERLQIAEQHSLEEQQLQKRQRIHYEHDLSRASSRSRTSSTALHRSLSISVRRRLRRVENRQQNYELTQQDAQFFLSLPEKIQKQHFSREEQVLLLGRCDQPPLPADGSLKLALHQQRLSDFHFGFPLLLDSEAERGRSRRRSRSISPTRLFSNKQRPSRESEKRLISFDAMSRPVSHQNASAFRRTLSLTNMPARHSTSSAPSLMDLPSFSPSPWHGRSTSLSISGRRSSHAPAAPVFDPEATHYQDPEARKKLRMFLASPQKFDEAVEFGFPSTVAPRNQYQLPPIKTHDRTLSRDMQTFLKDDTMSFLDESDGDSDSGDSLTDMDSPLTPSSISHPFPARVRHVSPSTFSSLDSTGLPPPHANREMTLRMTLTRPDLRADEEQLYSWQSQKSVKDDPFALEELELSDDMTGANGAFAVKPKSHGNIVSRLFKRASRMAR